MTCNDFFDSNLLLSFDKKIIFLNEVFFDCDIYASLEKYILIYHNGEPEKAESI